MAYAWENLSMRGGHIEWSCWGAPTIVVDPAAISDVLKEGESGEDEPGEGEAPTCGHPGNDLDDDHPGDGSYDTPGGGTGHPGDDEGDNGATPECGSESTEIDPFAD